MNLAKLVDVLPESVFTEVNSNLELSKFNLIWDADKSPSGITTVAITLSACSSIIIVPFIVNCAPDTPSNDDIFDIPE